MEGAFGYAVLAGVLLPWIAGYPLAVASGFDRGLRAHAFAAGLGVAVVLILCRAAQMWVPIGIAAPYLACALAVLIAAGWSRGAVRDAIVKSWRDDRLPLGLILLAMVVITLVVNAPIVFGHAIQFDGTRIHDSFTFTSSARYMLGHAFHGAADFDPAHPVYTISRNYFGDDAMQPRPAAEGFLALLSAWWRADPMALYNGLQTAGILLSGLSVFALLPASMRLGTGMWVLLVLVAFASPNLLNTAINSNFASALNLPAGTAYVALGMLPRTRNRFISACLLLGALMSGYPELLVFVGACRFLGVMLDLARSGAAASLRECALLLAEVAVAALLLPWAAHGTMQVYRTTFAMSHAGATELGGNMYSGLPLALLAAVGVLLAWRKLEDRRARALLAAVPLIFLLAQGAMVWRGFDYGGFRLAGYFATLLCGCLVACLPVLLAQGASQASMRGARYAGIALAAASVLMLGIRDISMVRHAQAFAIDQRITPDIVAMARRLGPAAHGEPVALGNTPSPFYYAMWLSYLSDAHLVFDFQADPAAAGYLSPYLRTHETARYADASLVIEVDATSDAGERLVDREGRVRLLRAASPSVTE